MAAWLRCVICALIHSLAVYILHAWLRCVICALIHLLAVGVPIEILLLYHSSVCLLSRIDSCCSRSEPRKTLVLHCFRSARKQSAFSILPDWLSPSWASPLVSDWIRSWHRWNSDSEQRWTRRIKECALDVFLHYVVPFLQRRLLKDSGTSVYALPTQDLEPIFQPNPSCSRKFNYRVFHMPSSSLLFSD
jgi:hypothetical protein